MRALLVQPLDMVSCEVVLLGKPFRVFGYEEDGAFRDIREKGTWAEFDLEALRPLVRPDSVCLDVGANLGMMSLAMSVLAPRGRVCALEASRRIAWALQETFAVNRVRGNAYLMAVGGEMRHVVWADVPSQSCSGSVVRYGIGRPEAISTRIVELETIDAMVGALGLERLDLIKLDVEGMERQALEGAAETLARFRPNCLIEFNTYALVHLQEQTPRQFLDFLFRAFDRIWYYRDRTGPLTPLTDREAFLNHNFFNGLVDDLLCEFEGGPRW